MTRKIKLVTAAGVAVAAALVWMLTRSAPQAAPLKRDAPVLESGLIRFSDEFAKRNAVSTVPVATKKLSPELSAMGTVTWDSRRFAAVGARISGRVHHVHRLTGDAVEAGDPLVEVDSAELGRAQAQLAGARAKELAAEAQMKRDRRLADEHIGSERDAELAKAELEATRAERVAAERAVAVLGGEADPAARLPTGRLRLTSPIAGKVVSSKVARGQTVEPTDTLFEVADLSVVWVQLKVFERDIGRVHVKDAVRIETPTGDVLSGEVQHVGDIIDVETRTAPVRVQVDNAEGRLRVGQSVTAAIDLDVPGGAQLAAPVAAVTRVDGNPVVFVLKEKGAVEPRPVKIGHEDGEHVVVLEGLNEGEHVVVGGLFALKSELFR